MGSVVKSVDVEEDLGLKSFTKGVTEKIFC